MTVRAPVRAGTFIALLLVCSACGSGPPKPRTHTVTIDATAFTPANLRIRTGDTVVWVNKDMFPHTATASGPGGFDSGAMPAGASWQRTFATAGEIDYICTYHPTMTGTVRVN